MSRLASMACVAALLGLAGCFADRSDTTSSRVNGCARSAVECDDSAGVQLARGDQEASSVVSQQQRTRHDSLAVAWTFVPTDEEERRLELALESVRQRYRRQADPLIGELYRLAADSSDTTTRRFLLVAGMRDTIAPQAANESIHFIVLEPFSGAVSPPSPWKIRRTPDGFGVTRIADLDGDGSADIAYCVWPDDENARGIAYAASFTQGMWHRIPSSSAGIPACAE